MSDINVKKRANEEINRWIDTVYQEGVRKGREETEAIFAEKDDTTTLTPATQEQKDKWNWFNLTAFCDKCEKGLGAHSGYYDFCPHCGRKIIKKKTSEDKTEKEV